MFTWWLTVYLSIAFDNKWHIHIWYIIRKLHFSYHMLHVQQKLQIARSFSSFHMYPNFWGINNLHVLSKSIGSGWIERITLNTLKNMIHVYIQIKYIQLHVSDIAFYSHLTIFSVFYCVLWHLVQSDIHIHVHKKNNFEFE